MRCLPQHAIKLALALVFSVPFYGCHKNAEIRVNEMGALGSGNMPGVKVIVEDGIEAKVGVAGVENRAGIEGEGNRAEVEGERGARGERGAGGVNPFPVLDPAGIHLDHPIIDHRRFDIDDGRPNFPGGRVDVDVLDPLPAGAQALSDCILWEHDWNLNNYYYLTADIRQNIPASLKCFNLIGSNYTFDCRNHTVENLGRDNDESVGFYLDRVSNVTLKNCVIRGFHTGISAVNISQSRLENNKVEANDTGIVVIGSNGNRFINNNACNNGVTDFACTQGGINNSGGRNLFGVVLNQCQNNFPRNPENYLSCDGEAVADNGGGENERWCVNDRGQAVRYNIRESNLDRDGDQRCDVAEGVDAGEGENARAEEPPATPAPVPEPIDPSPQFNRFEFSVTFANEGQGPRGPLFLDFFNGDEGQNISERSETYFQIPGESTYVEGVHLIGSFVPGRTYRIVKDFRNIDGVHEMHHMSQYEFMRIRNMSDYGFLNNGNRMWIPMIVSQIQVRFVNRVYNEERLQARAEEIAADHDRDRTRYPNNNVSSILRRLRRELEQNQLENGGEYYLETAVSELRFPMGRGNPPLVTPRGEYSMPLIESIDNYAMKLELYNGMGATYPLAQKAYQKLHSLANPGRWGTLKIGIKTSGVSGAGTDAAVTFGLSGFPNWDSDENYSMHWDAIDGEDSNFFERYQFNPFTFCGRGHETPDCLSGSAGVNYPSLFKNITMEYRGGGYFDAWHPDYFLFSLWFPEIGDFVRIHTGKYNYWIGENGQRETVTFKPYYLLELYTPYPE